LHKFKDVLDQQLPRRIQEDMGNEFESLPAWLRESLGIRLTEIVRNCTEDVYKTFPGPRVHTPSVSDEMVRSISELDHEHDASLELNEPAEPLPMFPQYTEAYTYPVPGTKEPVVLPNDPSFFDLDSVGFDQFFESFGPYRFT
jgi:hypothetical protein